MNIKKLLYFCLTYRLLIVIACISLVPLVHYVNRLGGVSPQSDLFNQSGSNREIIFRDSQNPSNLKTVNYSGLTPLAYAVFKGDWERERWEIESGADVNAVEPDEGNTPLHLGVLGAWVPKGIEIIRTLLDANAYVGAKTFDGNTGIHLANALMDNSLKVQVIRELVLNGCDINARNGGARLSLLHNGYTLMHLAAARHDTQAIDSLMAEFNTIIDPDVVDNNGRNAYAYAIKEVLSPFTATPEAEEGSVAGRLKGPYTKIVRRGEYDRNGLSGLHIAVMRDDPDWAQTVLNNGENIDVRSVLAVGARNYQYTPLHMAVLYERVPMVEWLLKNKALVLPDVNGNTPVHLVARSGDLKKQIGMLSLLLEKNPAIINIQNRDGQTLLHLLVRLNNVPLVEYLFQKYKNVVNPMVRDGAGEIPAQIAFRFGHPQMMTLLRAWAPR